MFADWFYGVIGHLESCNENCCECVYSGKKIVDSMFLLNVENILNLIF